MNIVARSVTARWTFDGWHCWPDAPEHRSYLAVRHRHLFHGTVTVNVDHDDRDVEFHDLRDVAVIVAPAGHEWGDWSCERIAQEIAAAVLAEWPGVTTVSVSEDGECDATVVATS